MERNEQDTRLDILNTLLTTPHRDLAKVYPVHQNMITQDPLFYSRLAAWYNSTGEVRDHKEMFIVNLCLSNFEGHRDIGLALLRQLPPYQLMRVVDFIHGRKVTRNVTTTTGVGSRRRNVTTKRTESFGLFKMIPRSVKTEVTRYIREREADANWFDYSVVIARKAFHRLYALFHIEPSERAQKVVFEDNPPKDSVLWAVKQLCRAKTGVEQAKVIIENKIPYRIASTVVTAMTPTIILALIEVMSDQELINSIGSLRRRGAFDNKEIKVVIQKRLEKAKTGKRVAALKSTEAAKASGVSDDIAQQLAEVADTQIKSRGRIKRSTALLIDKSGSMHQAIELGKRIATMVSAIMDADFFVYAFDEMAYPIKSKGNDLASWEKAFAGINAGGCTSCGVGIDALRRKKQSVEQIIMITDEGENRSPPFLTALQTYQKELGIETHVVFLKTQSACDKLEGLCSRNSISYDAWQFTGDYYSLPNLIPYLTAASRLDLLYEIMDYPLPERREKVA